MIFAGQKYMPLLPAIDAGVCAGHGTKLER